MVNKVILLGRLGADPELRYSQNRTAICSLKIATNERRKSADGEWTEHTEWHNVVTFGKTAENCNNYLKKGRQVYIDGKIQTRKYQDSEGKDRYWTEVIANTVQFVGSKGDDAGSGSSSSNRGGSQSIDSSSGPAFDPSVTGSLGESVSFDDDDIPF